MLLHMNCSLYAIVVACCVTLGVTSPLDIDTYDEPSRECEPINVEMCRGLGYNYTGRPNFLGHEEQQFSAQQLDTYKPLIQSGCAELLPQFLCAAYIPMCDIKVEQLIGPCRPVCELVKNQCQPILKRFGFTWPTALNCSVFPEKNDIAHMCIGFGVQPLPTTQAPPTTASPVGPPGWSPRVGSSASSSITNGPPKCLWKLKPEAYSYINSTGECLPKCQAHNLFTSDEKNFSEIWMAIWTSLSLLLTIFTIITFLLDNTRFHYPERPIIFFSLCYALYAVGYLLRNADWGRQQVTCDTDGTMTSGLDNTTCAAVFLLLYYFGTAAALWWIVLSLTWLLSAGLKWSHEAIELYSSYFHLIGWAIPAIQSIVVIVMREVGSYELSGLCYVTAESSTSLLGFAIAPLIGYLLIGIALLVAGFIVFFCHEKKQKNNKDTNIKMEMVMIRVGIFSIIYTVPLTCYIACLFYEYMNYSTWGLYPNTKPSVEIYTLKTFTALMPGFTGGLCLLGTRTLEIWGSLCGRKFSRKPHQKKITRSNYPLTYNNNNNSIPRQYMAVKANSIPSYVGKPLLYSSSTRYQPQGDRLCNSPSSSFLYSESVHVDSAPHMHLDRLDDI